MIKFTDFSLMPEIQKALDTLGFTKPTEIQEKIIPQLLANSKQDVHAQAQTGTGKTLAFGIPLLQQVDPKNKTVQALVVAPTRELVLQIYESLKEAARYTNISVEPIYGGMSIVRQIDAIRRGAQIIIGTPGRLNDHLKRKTLSIKDLKILVLDEADIMLDMGFKEEVDDILKYAPKDRSIWLFSATVGAGIKSLINSHMNNVITVKASEKGVVSSQVKQYYCIVPTRKRLEATARFIESEPEFYGIVFCQTKILTSEITEQLASRGFKANCLHGDMKQNLRNSVIKGFKKKDFNILVATDVAGRGIDVSDLTHVINFSIPEESENYIHRIGRTGRAGKEGVAIVFVAPNESYRIKRLEKSAKTTLEEIKVPELKTIIQTKIGAVSDFIEQSKSAESKSSAFTAVKELVDSFTVEEIKQACIVALQDKFFKDIIDENLNFTAVQSNFENQGGGSQEICIDLGSDNGITESEIRNYLIDKCKLSSSEITKVRVLQTRSFIGVSQDKMQTCFNEFKSNPVTPQKHRIFMVEDTFPGGRRSSDRDRRGGSGRRFGGDRERSGRGDRSGFRRRRR